MFWSCFISTIAERNLTGPVIGVAVGIMIMIPVLIIARRQAERRARNADRRAREAERMAEIGAMTSGLAHEIKNPLSTIGLNAQLLGEALAESTLPTEEKDRHQRKLETLRREITRLGGILTDFLQFAGRMKLDLHSRNLPNLIDELCDFYHPQCEKVGVLLRTQHSSESLYAKIDETLFKQALLNLMINAIQAMTATNMPEGPRELMVRTENQGDNAIVHVIDTGPGIDPDHLKEIFHPYMSTKAGGTGLGLPTARRIVIEHGGSITVHSEPHRGSDFTVTIPKTNPEQ